MYIHKPQQGKIDSFPRRPCAFFLIFATVLDCPKDFGHYYHQKVVAAVEEGCYSFAKETADNFGRG